MNSDTTRQGNHYTKPKSSAGWLNKDRKPTMLKTPHKMETWRVDTLPQMLNAAFADYTEPHRSAIAFMTTAQHAGCRRHMMLCTRMLAGIGSVPPPAQGRYYRDLLNRLDDALERESCWSKLRKVVVERWEDFRVPPRDCRTVSSQLVNTCAPSLGEAIFGCKGTRADEPMLTEALQGLRQAGEHLSDGLAGAMVQYSLTSYDYRPQYRDNTLIRTGDRMEALRELDLTCAFTLHMPERWAQASYSDQALTKLALWGDLSNRSLGDSGPTPSPKAQGAVIAKRRLAETIEPWMFQNLEMTALERLNISRKAAYWTEVAENLSPQTAATRAIYGLDPKPDLTENVEYPTRA